MSGFMDTALSVICLILFIRPLLKIFKQSSKRKTCHKSENFMIKYFVLVFIAIFSTGIWMILAIFSVFGSFAAIDVDINLLCVLFMSAAYQKYYDVLCRSCHSMVDKCYKSNSSELENVHSETTSTNL